MDPTPAEKVLERALRVIDALLFTNDRVEKTLLVQALQSMERMFHIPLFDHPNSSKSELEADNVIDPAERWKANTLNHEKPGLALPAQASKIQSRKRDDMPLIDLDDGQTFLTQDAGGDNLSAPEISEDSDASQTTLFRSQIEAPTSVQEEPVTSVRPLPKYVDVELPPWWPEDCRTHIKNRFNGTEKRPARRRTKQYTYAGSCDKRATDEGSRP